MAGSFSSKKVARAARTGGGRRSGNLNANIGYYAVLLVVAIIGTTIVIVSRSDRLDTNTPNNVPPLEPTETRQGDRWYEAYGVYTCDNFAPPITPESEDLFGFETRGDGVIYIHPFQKQYAGRNATFGRFAENVGIDLERNSFQLPGSDTVYRTGETKCGDQNGEVVAKVWSDANNDSTGEIRRGDPREIRLTDRGAVVLAFVAEGRTDIPLPPSAANLDAAATADASATPASPTTPATGDPAAPAPAAADTTAAPAAPATPAP